MSSFREYNPHSARSRSASSPPVHLNGTPAATPAIPALGEIPKDAWEIIRDWLRDHYRPAFKRAGAIFSATELREVGRLEATAIMAPELVALLQKAADWPKYADGTPKGRNDAPKFFRSWVGSGWAALLVTLPDQDSADLGAAAVQLAGDEFRRLLSEVMLSQLTLGDCITQQGVTQTEKRSLIEWCAKFAKPGPWRSIRSYQCWCKCVVDEAGEVTLKVAIRAGLLAQMHADRRLREMNQNTLSRRCERFGLGASTRKDRPEGQAAVALDQAFIGELLQTPPEEEEFGSVEKAEQPAEGEPRTRLFDSDATGLPD